jgi:hypothetical protein
MLNEILLFRVNLNCSATFEWGLRLTARARTFSGENVLCSSGLLRPHSNVRYAQTLVAIMTRLFVRRASCAAWCIFTFQIYESMMISFNYSKDRFSIGLLFRIYDIYISPFGIFDYFLIKGQ